MKFHALVPLVFILLTSCVSGQSTSNLPTEPLPEERYEQFSRDSALYEYCLRHDYMTNEEYGKGNLSLSKEVTHLEYFFIVDWNQLNDYKNQKVVELEEWYKSNKDNIELNENIKSNCQIQAGKLNIAYELELEDRRNRSNQPVVQYQQAPIVQRSSTMTSCNTYGSQVICNSY